ncbi:MAG TPA: hypothetical protein VI894_00240 [Candidatus Nanoarchaeia archaeon]|nr:hypothetical protein [Candidatus Nanoarchaeia archaeon]
MKCGINQNELKKSAEDSFGTARRLRDYAGHIKEKKSKGSVKEEKMASREIFKSIVNQYIDSAEYCFALEILNSSNEAGKKKYLDFMDKCLSRALSSAKAGAPDYFRKKNFLRTRELYNLLNEYSRVEPERANERVGLSKKIYGNADFKLDVGELILDELIVMKRGHKDVKSCEEKIRRLAGMIGHNPDRFIRSFYPKNI